MFSWFIDTEGVPCQSMPFSTCFAINYSSSVCFSDSSGRCKDTNSLLGVHTHTHRHTWIQSMMGRLVSPSSRWNVRHCCVWPAARRRHNLKGMMDHKSTSVSLLFTVWGRRGLLGSIEGHHITSHAPCRIYYLMCMQKPLKAFPLC